MDRRPLLVLAALASGALFGLGLAMSGMTDPRRVLGFLDVFGDFDPALLWVLGGAVATTTVLFRFVLRRGRPVLTETFHLSNLKQLDPKLVGGAALFGVGWGLVGLCPGPALANLFRGSSQLALFVAAMLAGMLLYRGIARAATEAPRELERAR